MITATPLGYGPLKDSLNDGASGKVERVIDLVAGEYDVSKVLILHHSRGRATTAKARQVAMYLAHVVLGQSLAQVGEVFNRDRTTVSYACGIIEDLRDNCAFDAELDRFEAMLNGDTTDV